MRTGASGVALGVVLALVLGSCSAPVAGPPAAPTRPRDVRLDGVDPCTLLTPAQRVELGLDQPPQSLPDGDRPLCSWRGEDPRAISVGISALAAVGIERYDTTSGLTTVERFEVRGFPALQLTLNGRPEYCTVAIDVAPGQALDTQFADGGRLPPIPQAQLCIDARKVADLAMGNLMTVR